MKYHHLGLIQTLLSSSTTPFYFVVKAAEEEEADQSVVFDPNECGGASSTLFSSAEQQQKLAALYFTAIPDQANSTLCQRANAVRAYLENYISKTCQMNITVQYRPVATYQDAVDALVNKIADFGWYGGLTGVQAGLRMPPSVYIAQRVEDTQFTSVFIQASGENNSNITDVNGKSLALGSQTSTSGSLMPTYYLTQYNVTPESIMYTGSHDATIDAVMNGEAEVGALNSVVWRNRVDVNTTGGTSVFYTTPEYVDYLWVAGAGIKDKWLSILDGNNDGSTTTIKDDACSNINTLLTNAFLAANASDSLGQALFEAYSTVGYVPITQGEYDPIEETGCAQNLIAPEYCSKPIPEDLGNVVTGSGSGGEEDGNGGTAATSNPSHTPSTTPDDQSNAKDPTSSGALQCLLIATIIPITYAVTASL